MTTTKHAVALRAFDHAGDSFAPGAAFPIDAGHLADWSSAGLVREATAAEVAKARGDKPARRPAAKSRSKPKVKAAAPASPADTGTDPATDTAAPAA